MVLEAWAMNVNLMLCVNNRHGNHTGGVDFVSVETGNAGMVLEAEGDRVPCGYLVTVKGRSFISVGRVQVKCSGYQYHVGNIHWDSATVAVTDAVEILNYLASQHWIMLEADVRLWDKWGALTDQDLREVLA